MRILVTGGAGFIGSAVVRHLIDDSGDTVVNVDKLTYAGNLESLTSVADDERYHFERVDICDRPEIDRILASFRPDAVMHLAAESHVDRSIDGPTEFIQTNVVGTFVLLEACREYWKTRGEPSGFRFHHVSTDEVYGSLGETGFFTEESPYQPNSPYSATKAASDHLVRAWGATYGLPVVVTSCSNNYGPYQFPEKLIPLIIQKALVHEKLPVYGEGANVRDWLHVEDHARALRIVIEKGESGETYNIGGHNERTNLSVVGAICDTLDELRPGGGQKRRDLITFVKDRPGHDMRYAIDASKIEWALGWRPRESFESGIRKTIEWYLNNTAWVESILNGSYRGERLGLS